MASKVDEKTKSWQDGRSFAVIELALFGAVLTAGLLNYLPLSNTPWLFLYGSLMLLARGRFWGSVGLRWPVHAASAIGLGLAAGVALSIHELVVLEPIVRSFTGEPPDLSVFKPLMGNLEKTLMLIGLSWVFAAFGEEMVWRGYALNRVASSLGGSAAAWCVAAIGVNVLFGMVHDYQELSGVIITAIGGLTYTLLYYLSGRNLAVPIAAHGMQNTCDFLFIYHGGIIPGL